MLATDYFLLSLICIIKNLDLRLAMLFLSMTQKHEVHFLTRLIFVHIFHSVLVKVLLSGAVCILGILTL